MNARSSIKVRATGQSPLVARVLPRDEFCVLEEIGVIADELQNLEVKGLLYQSDEDRHPQLFVDQGQGVQNAWNNIFLLLSSFVSRSKRETEFPVVVRPTTPETVGRPDLSYWDLGNKALFAVCECKPAAYNSEYSADRDRHSWGWRHYGEILK
jgi:hypothetical protein